MVLHGFGADGRTEPGYLQLFGYDGVHIPFFSTDFADMATDGLFRHSR